MINTSLYNDGGSRKNNQGGAAPRGKYYKRPEFNKDAERLKNEAHYAKVQLEIQREQAEKRQA